MNDMPPISTSIAPSQNKLKYFIFSMKTEIFCLKKNNIQPHRKPRFCMRSGGIHVRFTTLAESLCHFIGLAVGETAAILSAAKGGMRRGKECPRC